MRYLGGGIGHLEQFPPASADNQDITPYDISDEDIEETGKGNGPQDTAIADKVGHDDSGGTDESAEEEEGGGDSDTEQPNNKDQGESSDEETGNVY